MSIDSKRVQCCRACSTLAFTTISSKAWTDISMRLMLLLLSLHMLCKVVKLGFQTKHTDPFCVHYLEKRRQRWLLGREERRMDNHRVVQMDGELLEAG
eukprot:13120230-Ditylum_brightwellii.AAC.1